MDSCIPDVNLPSHNVFIYLSILRFACNNPKYSPGCGRTFCSPRGVRRSAATLVRAETYPQILVVAANFAQSLKWSRLRFGGGGREPTSLKSEEREMKRSLQDLHI